MNFLNSQEWREFQESVGRKTFSLDKDSYLIKMDLSFDKSYLYSPSPGSYKYIDEIKKIAKKEDAMFFKYEPFLKGKEAGKRAKELTGLGFKEAPKHLQPQKTIILDLQKSEEVLLDEMHSKARYNIRLAKRKGVVVKESKDIEKFLKLSKGTSGRDDFNLHPDEYYRKLIKMDNVKMFYASRKKEAWHAVAMVIFNKNRATYIHGASNYKYRKYMAPQRLQWEIIKYAKKKHYKEYDFWGIDKDKWPGVTRFKEGFGGKKIEYMGSFDLPIQKIWYAGYKIKNKI